MFSKLSKLMNKLIQVLFCLVIFSVCNFKDLISMFQEFYEYRFYSV